MNTVYQNFGLELHALIARLEPARWTEDIRPDLSRRFEALQTQLESIVHECGDDSRLIAVRSQLDEVALALDALPAPEDLRDRWMEFRTTIHLQYEALAEVLKACHIEIPSLRPTNYARSLVHVFFGVLAVLFVEIAPWWVAQTAIFGITGLAWFLEISRRYSERWNDILMFFFGPIAHPHERYRVNSSTWYATALTLLAFTGSQTACACAVTALGFGDPAAALVGRKFGRIKLVNNRSLEGTLTFAVVAFLTIAFVLVTWHTELAPLTVVAVAAAAASTSALAELFSRRIDDNFSIPLVGGAAAWLVLFLM